MVSTSIRYGQREREAELKEGCKVVAFWGEGGRWWEEHFGGMGEKTD